MRQRLSVKIFCIYSVALILLLFEAQLLAVVSVKDDRGRVIHLVHYPQRIISLAPNLTEILCDISVGHCLVAVDNNSDYPHEVLKLPKVADYGKLNLEAIVRLKPELVVVEDTQILKSQIHQLEELGIVVYVSRVHTISDIARTMQNLGSLTGHHDLAVLKSEQFLLAFKKLKEDAQEKQSVTVFYQLWDNPLLTINHYSIIHQVIKICGGDNIFATTMGSAVMVAEEAVIQKNPELILGSHRSDFQQRWYKWPQLRASEHHAIYNIPADIVQRPGPRLVLGAQLICKYIDQARKCQGRREQTQTF